MRDAAAASENGPRWSPALTPSGPWGLWFEQGVTASFAEYDAVASEASRLILEAFSARQLGLPSGGPKSADMLYEPATLAEDFAGLTLLENHALGVVLHEGSFHAGPANVVRLLATRDSTSELDYSI